MRTPLPTPQQLEYADWEFGLFLHFGIRTFFEGHRDWDGQPMPAQRFTPTALDCDNWCSNARQAGVKYAVLTAKHHDGFANWPSKLTDYSVAASPWRHGEGDVVREFVDACRRHDIAPGLYYSPADATRERFDSEQAYGEYFHGQVEELVTGYGPLAILWFDGCGSQGASYPWERIVATIRRHQPDTLLFNMGKPDYRWVGNELGIAPTPCWNTAASTPLAIDTDEEVKVSADEKVWLPAECDCRMRERNWFYSDSDTHTVKSLNELMGLYYYSVGRGCNLLLNIGPDRRGRLPDSDAARLVEFGAEIRRRFGEPLAGLEDFQRNDGGDWVWQPSQPQLVDHAVIQEDLRHGERIRRFSLDVRAGREWIPVWQGSSVGHKVICPFPPVKCSAFRLHVIESAGEPCLRALQTHYVS